MSRTKDVVGVYLLIAVVGAAVWAVTCSDDSPTTPNPVVTTPATPAPVSVTPAVVTPSPQPTATPDTRPIFADCNNATGICTFKTVDSRAYNVSAKCTEPAQDAPVHGTWSRTGVVDGDTVDARDVCNKIEPKDCEPVTKPVQVDFHAAGRHIGHLGPIWRMTLEQKLSPEECEGCVEEGPYVGKEIWDPTILEGPCPETFSTSCEEKCHQLGTQETTWDCQDPTTEDLCRPAPCPPEDTGCHISNQGGPGDTNFNIVITNAPAHPIHSQAYGFCPGDLFKDCSCRMARVAAEACGDPAAGGFVCKDER
jgi:hypothetical protein